MSIWAAIAVLLLWMFQSTNQAVVGTILPYYCKYVFHNDSWMYSTLYLSETIVLIVGVLYQLDKKYPAIMQSCAGNLYLRLFLLCPHRSAGRFPSVCRVRLADIHKKFIAAALRLSALLYIINAEQIPVSLLAITERFR